MQVLLCCSFSLELITSYMCPNANADESLKCIKLTRKNNVISRIEDSVKTALTLTQLFKFCIPSGFRRIRLKKNKFFKRLFSVGQTDPLDTKV